jgi:hypothetical protein
MCPLEISGGISLKGYPAGNKKVYPFIPFYTFPPGEFPLAEKRGETGIGVHSTMPVALEVLYTIFWLP